MKALKKHRALMSHEIIYLPFFLKEEFEVASPAVHWEDYLVNHRNTSFLMLHNSRDSRFEYMSLP